MTLPSSRDIIRAQEAFLDEPGWAASGRTKFESGLWQLIEASHRCNNLLWDEEDQARRKDVPDSAIAANKRAIDGLNQKRNDAIERIDESLLAMLEGVARRSDARMNSETAGAMIDRLSILALKIFHMRLQTRRTDATPRARRSVCGQARAARGAAPRPGGVLRPAARGMQGGNRLFQGLPAVQDVQRSGAESLSVRRTAASSQTDSPLQNVILRPQAEESHPGCAGTPPHRPFVLNSEWRYYYF